MVSRDEVADAVNIIYERHSKNDLGLDFVTDVCDNRLPYAMTQVLALDLVYNVRDQYTEIVIQGYKQLESDGYIGEGK